MGSQAFTASNASWPWPAGITTLTAECWGAGGGGGGVSGNPAAGGGGRGGGYASVVITKGAETTLNVTVGAAGTAGVSGGGNAGNGGTSSVVQVATTRVLAVGGVGGLGGTTNVDFAGATTNNGTAVGTASFSGGSGSNGVAATGGGAGGGVAGAAGAGNNASVSTGGTGKGPVAGTGNGAAGVATSTAGANGSNYGGGGSGGRANSNPNQAGGAGGPGYVLLTWVGEAYTQNIADTISISELVGKSFYIVAHTSAGSTDGSNVITPSIDTTGASLLIAYISSSNGKATSLTDSKGNTWLPLNVYENSLADWYKSQLFYCFTPIVGSGHTFSVTGAPTAYPSICVNAWIGLTSFGVQNGNQFYVDGVVVSTTLSTGSVTTTSDNQLIITGANTENGVIDSGFTKTDSVIGTSVAWGASLAYKLKSPAGSENPTWTHDSSTGASAAIATFGSTVALTKSLTDGLTLGDTRGGTSGFVRTRTEPLTMAEVLSRVSSFNRSYADALSVLESVARSSSFKKSVADALVLPDTVEKNLISPGAISQSDSLVLSELVTPIVLRKLLGDVLILSESISSTVIGAGAGITDAADRAQLVGKYSGLFVVVSNINTRNRRASIIGLDGSYRIVSPSPDGVIDVTDRAQLLGKYIGFAVSLSLIDTRNKRASIIGFDSSYSRVLPLPDGTIGSQDRSQLVGKYIGFYVPVGGALLKSIFDAISISEFVGRVSSFNRLITNPLGLSESIMANTFAGFILGLIEPLSVSDVLTRVASYKRSISDIILPSDNILRSSVFKRSLTDPIQVGDLMQRTLILIRALVDSISLTGSVSSNYVKYLVLADLIALLDSFTFTKIKAPPMKFPKRYTNVLVRSSNLRSFPGGGQGSGPTSGRRGGRSRSVRDYNPFG